MHHRDVPLRETRSRARSMPLAATVISLTVILACSSSGVKLGEVTYPGAPRLSAGSPAATTPNGACPGSLRTTASGRDIYGAWWEVRDDSSSILMVGRSTDGGRTWSIVQPADTLDRSRRGCTRPPPAIAADSSTNYVDIAYFMEAKEGPGVFFTHSMDARQLGSGDGVFHSPVAVVYGDKPARVAIAAHGDRVAVAYEDPNGERTMIGLALSQTMGHIFEQRVLVSQPELPAVAPLVAMRRDSVTVQWSERADSVPSGGRVVVRSATW